MIDQPWGRVSSVADAVLTAAAAVVDGGNDGDGGGEVLQKTREIFVSFFPFGLFFNWIFFPFFFFFSLSLYFLSQREM